MTTKWGSDLLIINNKELDNTMTMFQTKYKIEETKYPSLTKTFPTRTSYE